MVRDGAWFKVGFVWEEQPLAMQMSWDWDSSSLHASVLSRGGTRCEGRSWGGYWEEEARDPAGLALNQPLKGEQGQWKREQVKR